MKTNRRDFIGGALAVGALPLLNACAKTSGAKRPLKFLLMSDSHVESDFLENGRPVYTCWKPGNHASLVETYKFINADPSCREAQFALFCGDQINTGYLAQKKFLDEEMANYSRTLNALDLHAKTRADDLAAFKFRARPYVCRENLPHGLSPFEVVPPPLSSRVIAIQGNHDTGCPSFYRDCTFQCGDVRFISFFGPYVGLPAPKGQYRSTAKISDETLAFIEREMAAAAADPEIRQIVLTSHWSIVLDDPQHFKWPIVDACRENGFSDNRRKLLALAEKYGCRLYISGHEHNATWPIGKAGPLTNVSCGAVADGGSFALVEIGATKATLTVYACARAEEKGGVCRTVMTPRLLFTKEINLT